MHDGRAGGQVGGEEVLYTLELLPGATMADHCDGLHTTFKKEFPITMFGTCWPHIIRKWKEGEYCKKTW